METEKTFTNIEEFRKKTRFNEKLGLDDRDNVILSMISKNRLHPKNKKVPNSNII